MMNSLADLQALIVERISRILIGVAILFIVLFGAFLLLPAWADNAALTTDLEAVHQAVEQENSEEGTSPLDVLHAQLTSVENTLNEAAAAYLTANEADRILDRLYQYAADTEVTITSLQVQTLENSETDDVMVERRYAVELEGRVLNLFKFVTSFREAAALGVNLEHFTLTVYDTTASNSLANLVFDLVLYTSTYASGGVFEALPALQTPTPVPAFPTPLPSPTPTLTPTPIPSATVTPTVTPTLPASPTPYITLTPTLVEPIIGAGIYDDSDPVVHYFTGTWEAMASQGGYGGTYHFSANHDAQMSVSFIGSGVAVQYVAYHNFGMFEMLIDGELVGVVDGYAPQGTFGRVFQVDDLTQAIHTLVIRNTNRRNDASSGNIVAIDAVHILGAEN